MVQRHVPPSLAKQNQQSLKQLVGQLFAMLEPGAAKSIADGMVK